MDRTAQDVVEELGRMGYKAALITVAGEDGLPLDVDAETVSVRLLVAAPRGEMGRGEVIEMLFRALGLLGVEIQVGEFSNKPKE